MVFFFRRKKQQPLPRVIPEGGLTAALKSKYQLDSMKTRMVMTQLPAWGVKNEKGEIVESSASKLYRQEIIASLFHGEMGEVFKMSPASHKAFSRIYRKWLHAEDVYGVDHPYTKLLEKIAFYAYTLCLPRTVRKEHTTPQVIVPPFEMMFPWMSQAWSRIGDLGLIRPGAIVPKEKDEEEIEEGEE